MSEFTAAQIQFQTKRELESLRKNYSYIEQKLVRLANSRPMKVACSHLRRDLYRDEHITIAPVMSIWDINYKQERGAFHHYVIYISDTGNMLTPNMVLFYLIPDGNKNSNGFDTYKAISETEYQLTVNKFKLQNGDGPVAENYRKAVADCKSFAEEVQTKYKECKNWSVFEKLIDEYSTMPINPRIESAYFKSIQKEANSGKSFASIDLEQYIDKFIVPFEYNEKSIEHYKMFVVLVLRAFGKNMRIGKVRKDLRKRLEANGIEDIVNVEVDSSVDLHNGYVFSLLRNGDKSYEDIITHSFLNIENPELLEKSIIQLLKVYYEFRHITKENAVRLIKFLNDYGITESEFLDSLIEADPTGTWIYLPRGKQKEWKKYAPGDFRFIVRAKLMGRRYGSRKDENDNYELLETTAKYDLETLEKMNVIADQFNNTDEDVPEDTEILQIKFDPNTDNGFIFEMITYKAVISSDGTVDLNRTPDGRRLSAFTAMFNRSLPDIGKIYLDYKIDSKN